MPLPCRVIVVHRPFVYCTRHFNEGDHFLAWNYKRRMRIFSIVTYQSFALPLDYANFFVSFQSVLQKDNTAPFYPLTENKFKYVIAMNGYKLGHIRVKVATLLIFSDSANFLTLNCQGKKRVQQHNKPLFCGFYFFGKTYRLSPFYEPYTTIGLDDSAYHGGTGAAGAADEILSQSLLSESPAKVGGCLPSCCIQ